MPLLGETLRKISNLVQFRIITKVFTCLVSVSFDDEQVILKNHFGMLSKDVMSHMTSAPQ